MNIRDFLIEEIHFGCPVIVATVGDAGAEIHWSGQLRPGVEAGLRGEDGALPDWFKREVVAMGTTKDGSIMIAVE